MFVVSAATPLGFHALHVEFSHFFADTGFPFFDETWDHFFKEFSIPVIQDLLLFGFTGTFSDIEKDLFVGVIF